MNKFFFCLEDSPRDLGSPSDLSSVHSVGEPKPLLLLGFSTVWSVL